MDVDGTLTDGKIYLSRHGEEINAFNVKDGLGIKKLIDNKIIPVIITGRKSENLILRARELCVNDVYQGIENKLDKLKEIINHYRINSSEVAYIGDDENDLMCLRYVGLAGCPADAVEIVKTSVNFISTRNSGSGSVREFIEYILTDLSQ